jgi:hypothetical protein
LAIIEFEGDTLTHGQIEKEFRFWDLKSHFPTKIGLEQSLFRDQIHFFQHPGHGVLWICRRIRHEIKHAEYLLDGAAAPVSDRVEAERGRTVSVERSARDRDAESEPAPRSMKDSTPSARLHLPGRLR